MATDNPTETRGLDRFLRLFADVRPGEGGTAVLMALNVFLLLTEYYVLKPVREALILGQGSAELKSYMSAGMVGVLAVLVFAWTTYLALGGGGFAKMNIVIVTGWLVLAFFVGREYTRLASTGSQPGSRLVGSREGTAPALTAPVPG